MGTVLRGLLLTIALVMVLVLLNAAHAIQRIGDECFEQRTVSPVAPKAAPVVKRKAPVKRAGKPVRRTRFKHRVPAPKPAAQAAAPITKLFQVACPPDPVRAPDMVRKRAFVLPPPAPVAPVVVLPSQEFARLEQIDVTRDWYADHVGPVPERRFGVPVAPTLPLFVLGAALIAWRRKGGLK